MRLVRNIIGFIFLFILLLTLVQHILCPIYEYPPETTFKGNNFYNPYSDIQRRKKIKANFHAHTRVWFGLTNGRDNENDSLVQRYKFLLYDIAGISDYQSINDFQISDSLYIPEYEHGFGFTKNHQLSIGTSSVLWNDYLFHQTIDNKQDIIKNLRGKSEVMTIAHPLLRDAYSIQDMKKLTDYDCIEIVNRNYGQAFKLWDAALSSGHAVFGMGDDDSHSSSNPHDMGCCFNLILTDSASRNEVTNSLKLGKNIIVYQDGETMEIKRKKAIDLPSIQSFEMIEGTMIIKIDKVPDAVDFIGQSGSLKKHEAGKNIVSYAFEPQDTYIRCVISFGDGTIFYTNPVIRSEKGKPENQSAEINSRDTLILRVVGTSILLMLAILIVIRKMRKSLKRVSNED